MLLNVVSAVTSINKLFFLIFLDKLETNYFLPTSYIVKKRFTSFPSPAGMSLTKLPIGRNNSVMTSLFPPRESLVVTSRLGTGNSRTFFLRCTYAEFNGKKIIVYCNTKSSCSSSKYILALRRRNLAMSLHADSSNSSGPPTSPPPPSIQCPPLFYSTAARGGGGGQYTVRNTIQKHQDPCLLRISLRNCSPSAYKILL